MFKLARPVMTAMIIMPMGAPTNVQDPAVVMASCKTVKGVMMAITSTPMRASAPASSRPAAMDTPKWVSRPVTMAMGTMMIAVPMDVLKPNVEMALPGPALKNAMTRTKTLVMPV